MVLSRAPQATGEQATASQVCQPESQPSCFQPDRQSAPQLFFFTKNGEKCEMRVFRCYGTRSRVASSRRNTHRQVGSARASPLACSLIASRPRRFSPLTRFSVTSLCDIQSCTHIIPTHIHTNALCLTNRYTRSRTQTHTLAHHAHTHTCNLGDLGSPNCHNLSLTTSKPNV